MNDWNFIHYSQYSDVPREFVVCHGENAYYFESLFERKLDHYTPNFYVYRIPLGAAETPMNRWTEFRQLGEHLPDILVTRMRFHAEPIPGHPMCRNLRFVSFSIFEILART